MTWPRQTLRQIRALLLSFGGLLALMATVAILSLIYLLKGK